MIIKKKYFFYIILTASLILSIFNSNIKAKSILITNPDFSENNLIKYIEYIEDREKTLNITNILSEEINKKFIPLDEKSFGFGFSSSAYWIKFSIINKLKKDSTWFIEIAIPDIDRIDLYICNPAGTIIERIISGDNISFNKREIEHRNFIFKFKGKPEVKYTYFICLQSTSSLNLVTSLWSQKSFYKNIIHNQLALGIYYGAMIVMLIYNIFLFLSIRDKNYFYYIMFFVSFILFQSVENGLAFQYLWPNSIWWANNCLTFFIPICLIFNMQFARSFLNMKKYSPHIDRFLVILIFITILLIIAALFFDYSIIILFDVAVAIFSVSIVIAGSIIVLIKGYRPARFYLTAWAVFCFGTIVYSLMNFSFLPNNAVTFWGQQASSLSMVVLMSLGLADKINFMKRELEDLNVNLENIVEERTRGINFVVKEMERKDKEIQTELDLAGDIQQGILPQTPFYHEGIKIDAYYKSMGKVGGDFYDIYKMPGGFLGVLVADASGHGMPAAFLTALAKISFSEAIHGNLFPSDIYSQVNMDLVKVIKTDDFLTAFLLVISPSYEVFYCNASHQMAMVLKKDDLSVNFWDTNGLFLGAMDSANEMYEDNQEGLNYGDRILLYTDGIVDAKNPDNITYGEPRLEEMLVNTSSIPLEEAKLMIISDWQNFTDGAVQMDDATLMLIEIDPAYKKLIKYRENGFKLLNDKKYEESITELKKALEINADDEMSNLYIGECYLHYSDYSRAVIFFRKYLKNNEVDANVWCHLAKANYHNEDFKMARKAAYKSIQLRNDSIDALEVYGLSLEKLGMGDEAMDTWKKIFSLDANNKTAQDRINKGE